jgi:hypothetical protein
MFINYNKLVMDRINYYSKIVISNIWRILGSFMWLLVLIWGLKEYNNYWIHTIATVATIICIIGDLGYIMYIIHIIQDICAAN